MWIEELRLAHKLPKDYEASVADFIAPLAERVHALREELGRPVVIGINGAQGSGKTTFALFLGEYLRREHELTTASFSLDDLYLGKQDREALATDQHPLLGTRGVPGTHYVQHGKDLIRALTGQEDQSEVRLPVFDKAVDDLRPRSEWPSVAAPVEVVLFEGWCVGARPQRDVDLVDPVNALEATEDSDGTWRRFVNEELRGDYQDLFGMVDLLIMLRVPSFDKVIEWRELQEQQLPESRGMSTPEIRRFVMHFERLTRHMHTRMPDYCDAVIELDDEHRMNELTSGKR